MPELETAKTSDHETTHGLRGPTIGGGAADPPSGMQDWWKTPPSLVPPPAVDPAIYGIEPSDVGVETASHGIAGMLAAPKRHGGPSSGPHTIVDDVAADVASEHAEPASFDALIGTEAAASAGTGTNPELQTHLMQADGGRAHAMKDQLLIATKNIQAITKKIYDALAAASNVDERGHAGVVLQLESLIAEADGERGKIVLVTNQKFPDPDVQKGALYVSRASYELTQAMRKAKQYATSHGLALDDKKVAVVDRVQRDVGVLEGQLPKQDATATVGLAPVTETKQQLEQHSLDESLDGLWHSTQALGLAVGGSDATAAKTAMNNVLPGLLSNLAMLEASMVGGVTTTTNQRKTRRYIADGVATAVRDARGLGLDKDSNLARVDAGVPTVLKRFDQLPKGKQ